MTPRLPPLSAATPPPTARDGRGPGRLLRWAVGAIGLLFACHSTALAPLTIDSSAPAVVPSVAATAVVVDGSFPPAWMFELDRPEESTAQTTFRVDLVGSAVVALEARWVSQAQLSVAVPAGMTPGTYAVRVTDPGGRSAELASALVVWDGCLDASNCDDALPCTTDSCVDSICQHALAPDTCLIDGACWSGGQEDPAAPCTGCVAAVSTSARTDFADGAPCSDGNACTQGETCKGGKCKGPTTQTPCPATQCTSGGACDPATGACVRPPAREGAACDDGSACTTGDTCQAGECRGISVCQQAASTAPASAPLEAQPRAPGAPPDAPGPR